MVNEKKEETKSKFTRYLAVGLTAALFGGVFASVGLSTYSMRMQSAQNTKVSQFIDDERARQAEEAEQTSTYQEDGYKVMNQYEIRSTAAISDAYLKNDPSTLSGEDRETYDLAKAVLDEIIKDDMGSYEKELAIYDWMVEHIKQGSGHTISMPTQTSEAYTPYEVLKNKSGVCVGYATTFRLLANMVGLEVHIVHNDYHSWDMVKLDDGEWYQVDIYSDASGSKYRNFNMTDAEARNGHDWDESALPEAKGVKYSYAVQNAKEISDLLAVPEKVRKALEGKNKSSLFFKFPKKISDKDLALADQMLQMMQTAVYSLPNGETKEISASWLPDGADSYLLAIYVNDYSSTNTSLADADPAQVTEMTNKINELFGSMLTDPAADAAMDGTSIAVDDVVDRADTAVIGGADGPTAIATVGD